MEQSTRAASFLGCQPLLVRCDERALPKNTPKEDSREKHGGWSIRKGKLGDAEFELGTANTPFY